jgi:hypothetical protein
MLPGESVEGKGSVALDIVDRGVARARSTDEDDDR